MLNTRAISTALLLTIACGDSSSSGGNPGGGAIEGSRFAVSSVNGAPMPALLPTVRGCALTGTSGNLSLLTSGRFSAAFTYLENCRGFARTVNRTISGRYSRNGNNLVLAADSGFSKFAVAPLVTGTVSGDQLTLRSTPRPGSDVTIVARRM